MSDLYPSKRPDYVALTREPNDEDRAALYADLCQYGRFTGLWWLLNPEPPKQNVVSVPLVKEIAFSKEVIESSSLSRKVELFKASISICAEDLSKVSQLTIGQRDNPQWHVVRKGRLTASTFGSVLNAKQVTTSLLKQIVGAYNLSGVKSIAWGIANEDEAITTFSKQTGLVVARTGIWLDSSGVLGASPDGLVGEDYVLEVKCPFSQREESLEDSVKKNTFFLEKNGSIYSLKRNHIYWHQVQGQMYLTKRNNCYFVVWTKSWSVIVNVEKDPSWEGNIVKLRNFYFEKILPKIINDDMF